MSNRSMAPIGEEVRVEQYILLIAEHISRGEDEREWRNTAQKKADCQKRRGLEKDSARTSVGFI